MKVMMKKLFAWAMVLLLLLSASVIAVSSSETEAAHPQTLLALGDSLTTGYGLNNYVPGGNPYECNSYVNIIANEMGLVGGQTYINHAVNGDTSSDLAKLLPSLESQVKSAEMIIITIGGNDLLGMIPTIASQISGKTITDFAGAIEVFAATPPETYLALGSDPEFQQQMIAVLTKLATNLQTIAGFIHEKAPNARVIFLKQYNPLNNVPGFTSLGEFAGGLLDSLNSTIETTCQAYGYEVIDVPYVIDTNAVGLTNILQYDIHPNEQGHSEIAKLLSRHLGLSPEDGEETQNTEVTTAQPAETTTPSGEATQAPAETTASPEDATTPSQTETTAPETSGKDSQESATAPETTDLSEPAGCAATASSMAACMLAVCAAFILKKKHTVR